MKKKKTMRNTRFPLRGLQMFANYVMIDAPNNASSDIKQTVKGNVESDSRTRVGMNAFRNS